MLDWVPPPAPPQHKLMDIQFKGDVQVAAWRQRRGFSSQVHEDPATLGLSQNALAYILMEIESRRSKSHSLDAHLHEAMVELTPQLSQPHSKSEIEALAHVFAQPEMQTLLDGLEVGSLAERAGPAGLGLGREGDGVHAGDD